MKSCCDWRCAITTVVALTLAGGLSSGGGARAAEYYVAVGGNDGGSGTAANPFGSLARAQQAVSAGDTVWIHGGTYEFSGTSDDIGVLFNKSGLPGARINYWAYPGETPVFDFFQLTPQARVRGFSVRADWLHFRGLELRGVQQILTNVNESWGIRVENGADNNVFERLDLHHNEGPGLFIADGGNNLVLNSDSHHNYDPDRGGENADGFGSHSNDPGNTFIGNRAWENSDDGYDLINSRGQVVIRDSWSWRNGYVPETTTAAGNGAGFKAGGFGLNSGTFPAPEDVPVNEIDGNLSFFNRAQGFYANHHPGGLIFTNNTSYSNPRGFDLLNDVDPATWPADHFLRNNVSIGNGAELYNANQALIDDEFNTWNEGWDATPADFVTLSSAGVDGPRQLDGSLPRLDFLRLAAGSDLIDRGEATGRAYWGTALDLGAFEFRPADADLNRDGAVDGGDFLIWQRGLGLEQQTDYSQGDADGNGVVGATDLAVWQLQYGQLTGPAARPVPEPAAGALLVVIALPWVAWRHAGRLAAPPKDA